MTNASVHVTKLAAAKRQLQAAIRMHFLPEDELAVHTVAAAVYGILKDIKRERGMNEAANAYLTSVFYIVRDFRRGTLPSQMTSDQSFMADVEAMADQLPSINADTKFSDVKASIPAELERQYWNDTNRAANFLKHADRDSGGTLPLETLNTQLLLIKCCSAYQDIAPDDLGNEGLVFQAFVTANNPAYQARHTAFDSVVDLVKKIPAERQSAACYMIIRDLNAKDDEHTL